MWSDMFCKLANNGEYIGHNLVIPKEVVEKVPESVGVCFWSYSVIDEKVYAYGGINTKNVEILSSLGFGGVVVYGALAQKFNPVLADDFKEFISYFRLLRRATE